MFFKEHLWSTKNTYFEKHLQMVASTIKVIVNLFSYEKREILFLHKNTHHTITF